MKTILTLYPERDTIDAFRAIKLLELGYALKPAASRRDISVQRTVSVRGAGFLLEAGRHEGAIILCQSGSRLTVEWLHLLDQEGKLRNHVEHFPAHEHRMVADRLRGKLDEACEALDRQDIELGPYNDAELIHVCLEDMLRRQPLLNPIWRSVIFTISSVCDGRRLELIIQDQDHGSLDAGNITWFPMATEELELTFDTVLEWRGIGGPETQQFALEDGKVVAEAIHEHLQAFTRAIHCEGLAAWLGARLAMASRDS
jgi:hypothetical protein